MIVMLGAVLLVCFTAIVIYRMSIDRLRIQLQHKRLVQTDQFDQKRYTAVSQRALPEAQMPDLSGTIKVPRHPSTQATTKSTPHELEGFYYEAVEQEPRAGQQDECDGDLGHDQGAAQA